MQTNKKHSVPSGPSCTASVVVDKTQTVDVVVNFLNGEMYTKFRDKFKIGNRHFLLYRDEEVWRYIGLESLSYETA